MSANVWDDRADAYRESEAHREGADLDLLVEWASGARTGLDVASGGGHVARRLREAGLEVVTVDPAPGMQADVQAFAEDLPFADRSFDVVACRVGVHHFADVAAGMREMARVAADRVLVVDNLYMGEAAEEADLLRDPSHVRNYTEEEWRALFESAGLDVEETRRVDKSLHVGHWLERSACSGTDADKVRALLADRIEDDWITLDRIALKGARALVAIIVDRETRLVVQGITGREGSFHATRNLRYGTNVVAGVTPGKGGESVEGIPVFDTVADAVAETDPNTAMVFVPARFAADAIYEAVDAGIETVICITEGIPAHDMLRVYNYVRPRGVTLIGPNCPGVLSPGKANVGIIPAEIFSEGPVGLVSRSGTLTYQIGHELTQQGVGQSTIVGIGGDPVVGSSFIDVLTPLQRRPRDRDRRHGRRDRRRGGGEGRRVHRRRDDEAGRRLHRRLHRAARQDDGPRRRDHLRQRRHGAGQEGRARGEGSPGRNEPDRGRPAGGRGRRHRRLRQGRPGAPKSARASEVVYGVKVLEKMLEGPPPRVDPQAVANPPP